MVVAGEEGARGMELTSRSDASGRVFITRGGSVEVDAGGEVEVEVELDEGERNGWGACDDFSIQAARAEGSTGQADGGG